MGTFAETAIVDYSLWFTCQGKQTSVFRFRFPFIYIFWNGSVCISTYIYLHMLPFQYLYIYRIYKYTYLYISFYNYIYVYICCSFKWKAEAQAIFLNPFTVCSSCKRIFVVCPFVDEETNWSYLFTNRLNGLNGLAHLCVGVWWNQIISVVHWSI
jgi:hypothetical protein